MKSTRRLSLPLVALFATVAILGGAVSAAHATPEAKASLFLTKGAGYVVVNPARATSDSAGRTFYPTGNIPSTTLVVIPNADGTLPAGLTPAVLAQAAARLSASPSTITPMIATPETYVASSAGWTAPLNGQGILGSPGFKLTYQFNACGNCDQTNEGQGLGYYQGYNGSVFGTWQAWYNLGSAWTKPQPHNGGGTVPWGNVAAVAKFKAKCGTTAVCSGNWGP